MLNLLKEVSKHEICKHRCLIFWNVNRRRLMFSRKFCIQNGFDVTCYVTIYVICTSFSTDFKYLIEYIGVLIASVQFQYCNLFKGESDHNRSQILYVSCIQKIYNIRKFSDFLIMRMMLQTNKSMKIWLICQRDICRLTTQNCS